MNLSHFQRPSRYVRFCTKYIIQMLQQLTRLESIYQLTLTHTLSCMSNHVRLSRQRKSIKRDNFKDQPAESRVSIQLICIDHQVGSEKTSIESASQVSLDGKVGQLKLFLS